MSTSDSTSLDVDEARVAQVRAELKDSLDAWRAERHRFVLFAIACPLVLLGGVGAVAWLGSGRIPSTVCGVMFLFASLLALACLGGGLGAAADMHAEYAKAAWKLRALDSEVVQTGRAFDLAQSGARFVLFLRSFGAELSGLDSTWKKIGDVTRGLAMLRAAREGGRSVYGEDASHLIAYRKWSAQLEVLRSIQQRYPTILLGNTGLGSNMREELAGTGIIEVTIQAQDWWHIFLTLAHRAYLIVLYIEEASPTLLREMQHVATHGLRYAIFAHDTELRRLAEEATLGETFISSAVARLNPKDVADLKGNQGSELTIDTERRSCVELNC